MESQLEEVQTETYLLYNYCSKHWHLEQQELYFLSHLYQSKQSHCCFSKPVHMYLHHLLKSWKQLVIVIIVLVI